MNGKKFYSFCALVVLAMLPLAGCSGGSGSATSPLSPDKQTITLTVAGNVTDAAKTTGKSVGATTTLGTVSVFNAYSTATNTALGTADIQSDGTFTGLKFTLPTTRSAVVFKATLSGSTLRSIIPMDLSAPPTGLVNNNVSIIIDANSTAVAAKVATALGFATGKLLGDVGIHTNVAWTTVSAAVTTNGGQVLSFTTNGFTMIGSVTAPVVSQITVNLKNDACTVCHNTNDVADVVAAHTSLFTSATNTLSPRLNENNLTVSNIVVKADANGKPVVSFNLKKGTANYTTLASSSVRFYIADLVPKNTATVNYGTWGSDYFETWAANPAVTWDTTASASGNYTVTFPTAFGVAASTSSVADDYNAAHPQRLFIRISANSTTDPGYGGTVGILDFTVPAAGATAVALDTQKQFVTIDACKQCHGPQMNGAAHASGYLDTLGCVVCHTPLGGTAEEVYLPKFIHQIHAAIPVAAFPTRIGGKGYGAVTYPQNIKDCVVCHTDSGKTLGTGNKIANWNTNPTAEICGSCHTGANFTTGVGHAGGVSTNANCTVCHPATGTGFGKSVTDAHAIVAAAKDTPEYVATMAITPPATGTFYVAGETPTVTVTLKDAAGVAVPGAVYTAAKHAAGTFNAASLAKATLYVYGPRANAKPVLTKTATTLSAAGVPTQGQSLFVNSADPQITTSTSGFSYKLNAIPATMANGTYMVRFIAANYSYVADTDYKIDSTAFQTIQIGTATVEPKIAGDTCVNCHGAGNFAGHNARHSVIWNTDHCISCHDKSGNYGDPLDNRVHAVHSASKTADFHAVDWSDVTYPQGMPTIDSTTGKRTVTAPIRCITCHTSTATSGAGSQFKTSISEFSCVGCHADKPGAKTHFVSNGGKQL